MTDVIATNETILVVGGGISGMTAALEASETGKQVVLVEKNPTVGGRVSQLYKYFPKLCFPTCGMEINLKRSRQNNNLTVLTLAEVTAVSGKAGDYSVTVKMTPRFVNSNCTACGECGKAVEAEFSDEHNYEFMGAKRKGAYLPHNMAYPQRYVIDPRIIGTADADKAKAACKFDAVDLEQKEETIELKVGAIVYATGWRPYDANKIQPYGYDRIANVITSVEFERMADPNGPTGGKLVRPSDGKEAKNVAFIQCAGSRDRNHLKHCSRICCMASLKQTTYVQDAFGADANISVYYIDIRAIDRFEDFYKKVQAQDNVTFIKSKVANIVEDKDGNAVCRGVDTEGYTRYENPHDLVVLAIGMEPSVNFNNLGIDVVANEHGFLEPDEANGGIFAAGVASDALDVNRSVQSATAAALRAIQVVNRVGGTEA
ncbi:MAG: CoB--CoM heterodisulfide reductase iron-sulfur subunit A family protein [Gammaproteobacteria bacterium]|nr:CoB--CoM heterodisulfide reductase iron-sulfur subunit A family protein [Gammaproteobacteria bacterium]MCP5136776.1 CoB--CoM heterodisulfide reductase iron-sulfur subunit A family protein [Gammaproteobacteria bacterium]